MADYITILHPVYEAKDENGKRKVKRDANGEKVMKEITYRVDADFVPEAIDEISENFIQNYCLEKGKVEWLDAQYSAKEEVEVKAKNGKTFDGKRYKQGEKYLAPKSFVSIRSAFANEFFPKVIKGKKEKPETGRDKWEKMKKAAKKK